MKLEKKHLFIVGIALIITFHFALFFSPIIPVEESYFPKIEVYDRNGVLHVLPTEAGSYVCDVDCDGFLEIIVASPEPLNRTVYKSIYNLHQGS